MYLYTCPTNTWRYFDFLKFSSANFIGENGRINSIKFISRQTSSKIMENPRDKFHRCVHQTIRWSLKMVYLDVFDAHFRCSLGYCSVFGILLMAIFGCGFTIYTTESGRTAVYAAGWLIGFLQVNCLCQN